jgi:8-oxo-dGTP pyrophosphatase MutT (NUDIX family)
VSRVERPAARIVLQDGRGRVLLFRFDPAGRPPFWCTPGGAVDPGETYEVAARRELLEETGITADPGPQIARKMAEFVTLEGVPVVADERYFRVTIPSGMDPDAIDTGGHTALEREVLRSWRWFTRDDLNPLDEECFPVDLVTLLV